MGDSLDYLKILMALAELPFSVGKNLLVDFLVGDYKNKSVVKNRLDELSCFGSLDWERGELAAEIDRLIVSGMIEFSVSDYNKFVKVLSLTERGRREIDSPTLAEKKLANRVDFGKSEITDEDRVRFEKFGNFLKRFNDEQKKAIVSDSKKLLCVAGAGTGKTAVLTKRIEFLVRHKGVAPEKILAITFTRKAREEMMRRLQRFGVHGVAVHTFNSFCEMILRRHEGEIYGRAIRVQSYGDKILGVNMALASMGLDIREVVNDYFGSAQKKFRTSGQLINSFVNDCFSVMDYFKVSGEEDYDFSMDVDDKNKKNAKVIYNIIKFLREHMEIQGLRDYSDQIIDAMKFLRANPDRAPKFEYILVDEYQDVNAMQIDLLGLLKPENLFVVGDPRQAIFGWRGSDVSYILEFGRNRDAISEIERRENIGTRITQMNTDLNGKEMANEKCDVEVAHLTTNYRSRKEIVDFMNLAIVEMGLPDLMANQEAVGGEETGGGRRGRVRVLGFDSEEEERGFVVDEIVNSDIPNEEIFVLARTNRQLMELARVMKSRGVPHFVREEAGERKGEEEVEGRVTLATAHAIKGLQARKVFVIGVNEQNFPCKATDHPAIEMVKMGRYNREEEERRLFYVAISRARDDLCVTYSGKKASYYIKPTMFEAVGLGSGSSGPGYMGNLDEGDVNEFVREELKSWRRVLSEEGGVPAYVILTDGTIDEIAEKMPNDAEELARVSGIGPAKLVKYGGRILEIVREGVRG